MADGKMALDEEADVAEDGLMGQLRNMQLNAHIRVQVQRQVCPTPALPSLRQAAARRGPRKEKPRWFHFSFAAPL